MYIKSVDPREVRRGGQAIILVHIYYTLMLYLTLYSRYQVHIVIGSLSKCSVAHSQVRTIVHPYRYMAISRLGYLPN